MSGHCVAYAARSRGHKDPGHVRGPYAHQSEPLRPALDTDTNSSCSSSRVGCVRNFYTTSRCISSPCYRWCCVPRPQRDRSFGNDIISQHVADVDSYKLRWQGLASGTRLGRVLDVSPDMKVYLRYCARGAFKASRSFMLDASRCCSASLARVLSGITVRKRGRVL